MHLYELFSQADLNAHLAEGYVRVRNHPTLPLYTVGYTEKAQFDRVWDDVTNRCRGLIYDNYGQVLARPFDKFHNWDDAGQPYPPGGECYLSPKMDGSLGILYPVPYNGGYAIATRGSFESDQAIHATTIFQQERRDREFEVNPAMTYLFEIIYPENRIVVDYGKDDKLVLLDVLNTETGRSDLFEFHNFDWPHKVEKRLIRGFHDGLVHEIPSGEEGFVIYWPHRNYRVKMKSAEYVALHRIVTGLNARTVWSEMGSGKSEQEICNNLPDEFHDWVKDVGKQLRTRADSILIQVVKAGINAREKSGHLTGDRATRGAFAKLIAKHEYKGYIFAWLDNKDVLELIWKDLKPEAGWEPRNTQGEAA